MRACRPCNSRALASECDAERRRFEYANEIKEEQQLGRQQQ